MALHEAHDDMKHFADQTCAHVPDYKVGDQVWLSTKNLNINQPSRKLTKRQIGPYTITHVVSPNAIVLKLPPSFKIDVPINVSWLHPYKTPTIPGQQIMLQSPVEVEGEEEYVVEEILDSCIRHNKLEFLVKWEGYMRTICGNLRIIVRMRTMPLPLYTINILRHQDELCRCNLIISNSDLIKISCF